jgi:hypothetical protein
MLQPPVALYSLSCVLSPHHLNVMLQPPVALYSVAVSCLLTILVLCWSLLLLCIV